MLLRVLKVGVAVFITLLCLLKLAWLFLAGHNLQAELGPSASLGAMVALAAVATAMVVFCYLALDDLTAGLEWDIRGLTRRSLVGRIRLEWRDIAGYELTVSREGRPVYRLWDARGRTLMVRFDELESADEPLLFELERRLEPLTEALLGGVEARPWRLRATPRLWAAYAAFAVAALFGALLVGLAVRYAVEHGPRHEDALLAATGVGLLLLGVASLIYQLRQGQATVMDATGIGPVRPEGRLAWTAIERVRFERRTNERSVTEIAILEAGERCWQVTSQQRDYPLFLRRLAVLAPQARWRDGAGRAEPLWALWLDLVHGGRRR